MYPHLFLAGTFDGLHAGHQAVIKTAFRVSEKVTIGLTSDGFIAKFKSQIPISNVQMVRLRSPSRASRGTNPKSKIQNTIQSYRKRKRNLEAWLRAHGVFDRSMIIAIDDPYEPAASMPDLDALIVTAENRVTGERINAIRQGATLPQLTLIEVPIVPAEDGKSVSSTRMRNGEIDGNGRLIMPESMREALSKPLGRVLTGADVGRVLRSDLASQGPTLRITVGDIATKTFLDVGITPKLAIIDGMVGRKPFHETLNMLQPEKALPFQARGVKSGPGYISKKAIRAIQAAIEAQEHRTILIDGEEDLLVLPAILHAPFGSILYYGQPGEGLVEVVVTEGMKEEVRRLINRFIQSDK